MSNQSYLSDLITLAIQGDEAAICALYEETQDKVTQAVRALVRDEDAVQDIVQDSYIKGFHNLNRLSDPANYLTWMRRIASNTAVDYMRKKRPVLFSELSSEDSGEIELEEERIGNLPDMRLDQEETSRLIREIVSGLSEEQQLVIGMYYFEEVPIKTIAKKLGCSENTVKSRLNYGRKNVEKKVRELERQGTKLYSMAPLTFFLWLLRNTHSQPSNAVLETVLLRSKVPATQPAAPSGFKAPKASKAVTKTVDRAAKKLTARIAAGIVAGVVAIGGAAAAILGSSPRGAEEPLPPETSAAATAAEATQPNAVTEAAIPVPVLAAGYQEVLDEARAASRHPYEDGPFYYHFYSGFRMDYSCIDLDGNGVDELLLGRNGEILDVYTLDGENAVQVMNVFFFGGAGGKLTVMETGEMYVAAGNGFDHCMMKLAVDGVSTENVFTYTLADGIYMDAAGQRDLTAEEFQKRLDQYTPLSGIQWIPFIGVDEKTVQCYQPILDEYIAACNDPDYLDHRERYPNTINAAMGYYHSQGAFDVYYSFFDIDNNGSYELLIGFDGSPWDIYALNGQTPVKLVDNSALGSRASLTVMDTGEIYFTGSSGASDSSFEMLRIGKDGFSTETVFSIKTVMIESELYYQGWDETGEVLLSQEEFDAKQGEYSERYLPWELFIQAPMTRQDAYQEIMNEYSAMASALSAGTYVHEDYPHAKNINSRHLCDAMDDIYGFTLGYGDGFVIAYAYYDIDFNGTDELLIGVAQGYGGHFSEYEKMAIIDAYTYDGKQAVQLFQDSSLGDTSHLLVGTDRRIHLLDDSSENGKRICLRIDSDGFTPVVVYDYQIRMENGQKIYYCETATLTEAEFEAAHPPFYAVENRAIQWEYLAEHGPASWDSEPLPEYDPEG